MEPEEDRNEDIEREAFLRQLQAPAPQVNYIHSISELEAFVWRIDALGPQEGKASDEAGKAPPAPPPASPPASPPPPAVALPLEDLEELEVPHEPTPAVDQEESEDDQTPGVKPALAILGERIYLHDEEGLTDACWQLLSYLSDGPDKIQDVIEAGVCARLVELLGHPSPTVLIPTLRTVGNMVSGDDNQTQLLIENDVLPHLYQLLVQNHLESIKKDACWTISNITAGNGAQIQAVIEANLILPLVHLLQHAVFDIKKEAARAISNAISGGSHKQIRFLVGQGIIKPLCHLLICQDPEIVLLCLEGLKKILKVGEADKKMRRNSGINLHARMIEECHGLGKIESLRTHQNQEIYDKAVNILDRYWAAESEEEFPRWWE